MFGVRIAFAICLAAVGLYLAFIEMTVLWLPELHSQFGLVPHWKSALILLLIGASALAPLYAAFRMVQYAAGRFKMSPDATAVPDEKQIPYR